MPSIDKSVKSGTGNERKKRWGVDRGNDIGPDSNPCPPWASSPNVLSLTFNGNPVHRPCDRGLRVTPDETRHDATLFGRQDEVPRGASPVGGSCVSGRGTGTQFNQNQFREEQENRQAK